MKLFFMKNDGQREEREVGDQPMTIGRGRDADWQIIDEKISRIHCGVRKIEDDWHLRDLHSRNGTHVNGQMLETALLKNGDLIRIGNVTIHVETADKSGAKPLTASQSIRSLSNDMAGGKGYTTILNEIVKDIK